ncbi:hypothetical protein [Candidatus Magnetominusculus xianensis]|uniref:Secreted protein n=1 Tax=Candidatus Magnetominusculus xianensis TaxID=1748249 RepID=A0ABR5SH90_9BACT|nr:hypothetical protein [Candidatus Magnetominusculus xianensis]KWT91060.1 hypothetical protein ASN18_0884 [Candidatus Magnetominusculus xianensis]MBF0403294.1 hypothetical protein [Nitrospirota bacterium]
MMRKIAVIVILLLVPALVYSETMQVITKENAVRADCNFYSAVKAMVKYADTLEIVSTKGDWYMVKFGDKSGCIHKTALNKTAVALAKTEGGKHTASKDEVSLAGKGFNPQVEDAYKKKHPELDFDLVTKIEGFTVPAEKVAAFIKDGGLKE